MCLYSQPVEPSAQELAGAPRLGGALPAVLQRSRAEAAVLVAHLPAQDRQRLRTWTLALRRLQPVLRLSLPADLPRHILSLIYA